MEALKQSAQENVEASRRKGKETAEKTPDYRKSTGSDAARQTDQEHVKEKSPSSPLQQEEQKIREAVSDVRIRVRDSVAEKGEDSVFWISQKPVFENRQFAQFMLPDGAVVAHGSQQSDRKKDGPEKERNTLRPGSVSRGSKPSPIPEKEKRL